METVFTISGALDNPGWGLGEPPTDVECAEPLKPLVVAGVASTIAGVGAVGFSIYKFGQRRVGAGFGSVAAAMALAWIGHKMILSAANSFMQCKGRP